MKRSSGVFASAILAYTVSVSNHAHAANGFGAEVGAVGALNPSFGAQLAGSQIGFRSTGTQPFVPAADVSFAVVPEALAFGAVVALLDVDLTVPVPIGSWLSLTPRIGVSAIGAGVADYGGGVLFGGNVGLGTVVRLSDRISCRADVTLRQMIVNADVSTIPQIVSVTTGLTWTMSGRGRSDGGAPDYPGTGRLEKKRPKPAQPAPSGN